MKRKLIKQGQGGFTVTVPVKWVREFNLKSGSEIDVNETEDGLLISAQLVKRERAIVLDITPYHKRMILNLLNQSYRLGYDIITIKCKDSQKKSIEEFLPRLLGFEITNTKGDYVLQNIAEPDSEKFDTILRRMFLLILELSEEIVSAIESGNQIDLVKKKENIDRLTNYLRRTVIRSHNGGSKSSFLYSLISKQSLISHSYTYFYQYFNRQNISISKDFLLHLKTTTVFYREFYNAYYKKDLNLLSEIDTKKKELFLNNDTLILGKGHQNILLTHMREIIRLTQMSSTFAIGYYL